MRASLWEVENRNKMHIYLYTESLYTTDNIIRYCTYILKVLLTEMQFCTRIGLKCGNSQSDRPT